jgi:hypothetical protein
MVMGPPLDDARHVFERMAAEIRGRDRHRITGICCRKERWRLSACTSLRAIRSCGRNSAIGAGAKLVPTYQLNAYFRGRCRNEETVSNDRLSGIDHGGIVRITCQLRPI